MKFLITTFAEPKRTPEHYLSPDEIVAGPHYNKVWKDGQLRFLGMPTAICDVPHLWNAIPDGQKPDMVVVNHDPNYEWMLERFPEGLLRILMVGGTHYGSRAIASVVEYALKNKFSAIFLWNRQHAHFFREAGFQNVFWMPGLLMSVPMRNVRPCTGVRENKIAFFGYANQYQPNRVRMLRALTDSGLPLESGPLPLQDGLERYGRNLIAFNASRNSDISLRVFEATSMGAMLLTDKLSSQTGLECFFKDGESMVTYEGSKDLLEKASYYLAHPEEALAIGRKGQEVYNAHFSFEARRTAFLSILRGKSPLPCYTLSDEPRCLLPAAKTPAERSALGHRVLVYEWLQAQHHASESVTADVVSFSSPLVVSDIADLKRLKIRARAPLTRNAEVITRAFNPLNVNVEMDDSPLTGATLLIADTDSLNRPEIVSLIENGSYHSVFFGDITPANRDAVTARMQSLGMTTSGSSQTFYYRKVGDITFDTDRVIH
jgi:glycosyltransferase involved in cell wall biosynthesis